MSRHRAPEPTSPPPPPRTSNTPKAAQPSLLEQYASIVWIGAGLLVVALAAYVYFVVQPGQDSTSTTPTSTQTTAPSITTSAPALLPEQVEQATRDAFFELTTGERGFTQYYGESSAAPALGVNVCSQLNADPTSDGVWGAAARLEQGLNQFPVDAAWAFVSISVTVYCDEHEALVNQTIQEVTS